MIKRLVGMAMGISLVALAGCAHKASPTTQPTLDVRNPHVQRAWMADLSLKDDKVDSIHLRDGRVYVYTDNNQVYVLSRYGGAIEWSAQVGASFTSMLPPIELGKRVVFPVNTRLFIYDLNGIQERVQDLPFAMQAPGVGQGHMIYVGAAYPGSSRMSAVDVDKPVGEITWEFRTQGPISGAPALHDNVLYVGSEDGRVYAVTTSRQVLWGLPGYSFPTQGRVVADLKADDYAVYAASTDSKLYALDRMTGKIKWAYFAETGLETSPTVAGDTVYQFVPGKGLVAIDKTKGAYYRVPKWVAEDATAVLSVGSKHVYVRLRDGSVGALDKATGELLWQGAHRYAKFANNPTDATVFVATSDGKVYCYQPVGEKPATRPAAAPAVPAVPATTSGPVGMNGRTMNHGSATATAPAAAPAGTPAP